MYFPDGSAPAVGDAEPCRGDNQALDRAYPEHGDGPF